MENRADPLAFLHTRPSGILSPLERERDSVRILQPADALCAPESERRPPARPDTASDPKPSRAGGRRSNVRFVVRIPRNPYSRVELLNRGGRHPACRRAGASSPAEKASNQSTRRNGWQGVRAAGCLPLRSGSWGASTSYNRTRIGIMNRKRRQAGRTPNASRVSGALKRRGSVWSAWSLLPLFGAGSWKGDSPYFLGPLNPSQRVKLSEPVEMCASACPLTHVNLASCRFEKI